MAVLGCTELSLVKRDEHLGKFFIDSTEVCCAGTRLEACGGEADRVLALCRGWA